MTSAIERLPDGSTKKWYEEHGTLDHVVEKFEPEGYTLNDGGILLKPIPEEIQERLGHTTIDIVLPRPTDYHYHEDVAERIRVLSGSGYLFRGDFHSGAKGTKLEPAYSTILVVEEQHGYKLIGPENYLEIRLVCSGILDPEKEVLVRSFDGW